MSAKGIKLLNSLESNWTNNYWALSKAFATMTHQNAHRITHGLFCKMRNIRSPYLASCGIVLFERNKRAKVFQGLHNAQQPRCTYCTSTVSKCNLAELLVKKRQKILLAIFPSMNNGCDKNASLTISHSTLSHPPLSDVGWPRSTHAKISSCPTVSISSAVSKAVSISCTVYILHTLIL